MPLQIARSALAAMLADAALAGECEACGLLLGTDGLIREARPTRNVHPTPATRFELDPQALIDAHRQARSGGPCVLGYYHSHPNGASEPSATDREMAHGDGMIWAIVAAGQVAGQVGYWRDEPTGFTRLEADIV